MRSVAVLLLLATGYSAARASTDRVHESHAIRSIPRRNHLLVIAESSRPAPTSPSRCDVVMESALDEEDPNDLDPLFAPLRAIEIGAPVMSGSQHVFPSSPPPSQACRTASPLLRC
jgi:hypothetical protein